MWYIYNMNEVNVMRFLKILFNIISSKKITQTLLNILGILLIGVLFMANSPIWHNALTTVWVLVKPFLFGFVIAFALNPLINWFEDRTKNRGLSVGIIYTLAITIVVAIISLIIPVLYNNISEMIPAFESGLAEIQIFFSNHLDYDISSLVRHIQSLVNDLLKDSTVLNTTLDVLMQALSTTTNIFIYIILAIYMSFNYDSIKVTIARLSNKLDKHLPSYLVQIDYSMIQYIKAFVIGALAQGAMAAVMYLAIGQPNWLVLGLLSAISCIFPYIGPIAANCLGVVVSLSMGSTTIIILLILIFIQSTIMSYIITPKIYSSRIDLSVMWVLFGILSGSTLFGIWGMVIAMPLLVSIKIIYQVFKEEHPYHKV